VRYRSVLRTIALAALTPLLEKNVTKTLALDVPAVFSMSRVIVLAFAIGMLRQIWRVGVAGWPEATLAIAVVLALPILGALDRAQPDQLIDFAKSVVGRFGIGGCRAERSEAPAPEEPSRYNDHRID
jgi:peptidoglycan/LPS O-acetylase OafA/YrhL